MVYCGYVWCLLGGQSLGSLDLLMDGTSIKFDEVFMVTKGLDLLVDSTSINLSTVEEREEKLMFTNSPNNQEIMVINL